MRLISQNGYHDVPYESVIIQLLHEENTIYAYSPFDLTNNICCILLGKYSTEKDALKVMKMCRDEYKKYEIMQHGYGIGMVDNPKVFRFPKDEEV